MYSSASSPGGRTLVLCLAILALASVASASWKEKVLYSFQGSGWPTHFNRNSKLQMK